MAEKHAAHDPDRFTWNRQWKQAKKGRDGSDGDYGRTQKLRCQQMLEAYGIFTPARRLRNGVWRIGWDVADHDKISRVEDGWCHLSVSRCVISPRKRGEGLEEYLRTIGEAVAEGIKNEPEGITEGITKGIKNFPEGISNLCNPFTEKDMEGGENRTDGASPVTQLAQLKRAQFSPSQSPEAVPNGCQVQDLPVASRRSPSSSLRSDQTNPNPNPNTNPVLIELPEDFKPDGSNVRFAKQHGLNIEEEYALFESIHRSHGNVRENWQKVFRRWLIDAAPLRGRIFDLPDWLPVKEWNEYLAMRERIGKGATQAAQRIAVRVLGEWRDQGQNIAAVLNRSTEKQWSGIFPVRGTQNALQSGK